MNSSGHLILGYPEFQSKPKTRTTPFGAACTEYQTEIIFVGPFGEQAIYVVANPQQRHCKSASVHRHRSSSPQIRIHIAGRTPPSFYMSQTNGPRTRLDDGQQLRAAIVATSISQYTPISEWIPSRIPYWIISCLDMAYRSPLYIYIYIYIYKYIYIYIYIYIFTIWHSLVYLVNSIASANMLMTFPIQYHMLQSHCMP